MNPETINFLRQHLDDDPIKLLLQQASYPQVDMKFVAQQIEAHKQALHKWPTLACCNDYYFPPKINREQSSSEHTALYKQCFIESHYTIADLTGGMGIDTLAFSAIATHVDYIEQDAALCQLMQHNLQALNISNVDCHNADSIEWLRHNEQHFNCIFIDPARRNSNGGKVCAFEDCTPNLLQHLDLILDRCDKLIIKASPMIDLAQASAQLHSVSQIHIVAHKNECKEVLFVCTSATAPILYHCVNIQPDSNSLFRFTREEEQEATAQYATQVAEYLYEPNVALMKGGAYKLIAQRTETLALDRNSHLYTHPQLIESFPGRIFKVLRPITLTPKTIKKEIPDGRAHILVRNYPLSAPLLQHKLKLIESGDLYIIATTLAAKPSAYLCQRIMG